MSDDTDLIKDRLDLADFIGVIAPWIIYPVLHLENYFFIFKRPPLWKNW